jgi:hypothetical protein
MADRLVGGQGTLATPKPIQLYPPRHAAGRAAVAQRRLRGLRLHTQSDGLLPADAMLDARTLPAIKMPNRGMFVDDPRPDVRNTACKMDC